MYRKYGDILKEKLWKESMLNFVKDYLSSRDLQITMICAELGRVPLTVNTIFNMIRY